VTYKKFLLKLFHAVAILMISFLAMEV